MSSRLSFNDALGRPLTILSFGYPLAIFALLSLPSTSYARDIFNITVALYLWRDWRHGKECFSLLIKNPTILAGITLITYVTVSAFWSQEPLIRTTNEQIRNGINTILFWICTCLYLYKDENALKRLFWTLSAGLIANLLGTWLTGTELFHGNSNRIKGYGILINPIFVSSVAVIQIAIGLSLRQASLYERTITLAMMAISTTISLLTLSRGPLLALLTTIVIYLICTQQIRLMHKFVLAVTAASIALLLTFATDLIEILLSRGASKRPAIWQETITYAQHHIYIGWGWLNDFSQSVGRHDLQLLTNQLILHPHSLLISSLFYGGLIGLAINIAFILLLTKDTVTNKTRNLSYSLLSAIILLTAVDTHTPVTKRDFMLIILWLPAAIIIMSKLQLKKTQSALE